MIAPEVLVVGGGVAGTTAALALRQHGLEVAVIEAHPEPRWRIGETLAAEARPVLQALSLWSAHVQRGHLPSYGNASCWGWEAMVDKDFTANLHGHAWQLDRAEFEAELSAAAEQRGVTVLRGTPLKHLARDGIAWTAQVGNSELRVPWVIDASGRRALVARALGVRRQTFDSLVAIYAVAHSVTASDNDSRTFIEAVADGWFYTALTPGGKRTVSFQTDADFLPSGQTWRSREWFSQKLSDTRHLAALLTRHDYVFESPPELTSAHSGRLEKFSGPGWLAVGDAAMSFDPVSGHGLLKAMQSGMMCGDVVSNAPSNPSNDFERWNERLWADFVRSRDHCYAMERRWPHSLFWQRRLVENLTQRD